MQSSSWTITARKPVVMIDAAIRPDDALATRFGDRSRLGCDRRRGKVAALVVLCACGRGAGKRRRRRPRRAAQLHLVQQAAVSADLRHARDGGDAADLSGRRRRRRSRPAAVAGGSSAEGSTTRVRYDWTIVTTKRWMNALAPLLEPAFRWNHHQVMAEGGRGLAKYLGRSACWRTDAALGALRLEACCAGNASCRRR